MIKNVLQKIFGTRNERVIKKLLKNVSIINSLENQMKILSDEELRKKTFSFNHRLQSGETLDDLLPEAFAVVREASFRTLGLRHFDVQLIGGMVLHSGKIAEMRTGEGKTIVATLAAYLNALTKKSVHIVTANDYLAKRDSEWMFPIYNFLGLSVGVIISSQSHNEKKESYAKDIVYGTSNEFGFDYLRDNMVFNIEDKVQRNLYFAIIDEVDSILIDEARTPLIISGPSEESHSLYKQLNSLVPYLKKQDTFNIQENNINNDNGNNSDYIVDEKLKQVYLTEIGYQNLEKLCLNFNLIKFGENLYDAQNIRKMYYVNAALRAHALFHKDIDYIVKNGDVIIIDEHTGRALSGRRWSEGLHQAIEAKEGVEINNENQTLASITFQNYFRIYDKLSGMTGTADTEAYEFQQIYGLEVIVIPTHKPMVRNDLSDKIYLTSKEKFFAILQDVKERHEKGQPILVGTTSIETSEKLSNLFFNNGIKHLVLNAKHHEQEAKIIAQAGLPGSVTIATNMAGRGTDIVLGGNLGIELKNFGNANEFNNINHLIEKIKIDWKLRHDQVVSVGGLHVIGSERHESRRIDNQLRGRSGRQGDPGSSRFYLSLEDNLLRIFASDKISKFMKTIGMNENEVIEHSLITRAVENAQRKVEGHNFDIRKHLLEFDNIANEQRMVIYRQRDEIISASNISELIKLMREDVINEFINDFVLTDNKNDIFSFKQKLYKEFEINVPLELWINTKNPCDLNILKNNILEIFIKNYNQKEEQIGYLILREIERSVMLQVLDSYWKDHLASMDYLRDGIHLRGYAQQNPTQEYKKESFNMFSNMIKMVQLDVIKMLSTMPIKTEYDATEIIEERKKQLELEQSQMNFIHDLNNSLVEKDNMDDDLKLNEQNTTYVRINPKVGRNSSCPCGSGKKYKICHGKSE